MPELFQGYQVSSSLALFPQVRQGVLAATLGQPDKWWYLSELAGRLGTSPSSLQRELSSLVASGILVHRREGTRAYFRAETESAVFRDLQQLLEKTAGLAPILEQILKPFGQKIQCAFIYGSVARSREHAMSDVDVMVIGRAGLADLSPALRKAEARLGREVNVTAYSVEEFRQKIKSRGTFHTFNFGMHLVGDPTTGAVYQESPNIYADFGNPLRRVRRGPYITRELEWIYVSRLQVDVETGVLLNGKFTWRPSPISMMLCVPLRNDLLRRSFRHWCLLRLSGT